MLRRRTLACALACASIVSGTAHAQDAGPGDTTPTDTPADTPGADPAAPQEQTPAEQRPAEEPAVDPAVMEEARQHFRQALAFADAGNCGAAIVEFQAAYDLVPRPNALYNIGGCQERLFRYDLAIEFYERYLAEAPPDAPDRPATEAALRTLRNLLGVVRVASNVPAEVWIDDRLSGNAPGEVFVPAGGHTLELRADGYIPKRTEFKIVGRQEIDIELTLDEARTTIEVTETTGLDPTLFYAGLSATVVTGAVGTVFAFRVKALHDDAAELPAVHPERTKAQKKVQDTELVADIFFGATAVLAVGTTIVYFITDWDGEDRPPPNGTPPVSLRPAAGPGFAGLSLSGAL